MARIWIENHIDFVDSRNLFTVDEVLTFGADDFTMRIGSFTLGGIDISTLMALFLYQ